MKAAAVALRWLLLLEKSTTTLAFAVMVLVLGWDIVGRELLGSGKIWATPIAVYCNVVVVFLGMGLASAGGSHLRPRFFDKLVPRALDGAFSRATDIGFALFCAGAAYLCVLLLRETAKLEETDAVLQWQVWPFQTVLVATFAFAVLRHSIYAGWPALRPAQHGGGEDAPPTAEQVEAFQAQAEVKAEVKA